MPDAFDWIQKNGIMSDSSYGYEGSNGKCRHRPSKVVASCSGFASVPRGSEAKLKEAVSNIGPVAIGIDAHFPSLQFYTGGVYFESKCDPNNLNHAVTIVGYDSDGPGHDYWIVKNSWGENWGGKSFISFEFLSLNLFPSFDGR